jgi:hypothetical protein
MAQSRWTRITGVQTPSGKSIFGCGVCGRTSTTPDKRCTTWQSLREPHSCNGWDDDDLPEDLQKIRDEYRAELQESEGESDG